MSAFRLGGLLRLRRLEEEQAAADLARANADRRVADERRRNTAADLAASELPASGDELSFQAAVAGRASLMGLFTECTMALDAAGARADEAQQVWTVRRTAVRTLDKLEERHEAAERAEEARAEQLLLDEVAGRGAPKEER